MDNSTATPLWPQGMTRISAVFFKKITINMCTMAISGSVCRAKPVKISRDKTLDGLPAAIRRQCATARGRRAYLASIGVSRAGGVLKVVPV